MSPGQPDVAVVRRHLLALDAAVQRLQRHAGRPLAALVADADTLWAIERGLQLCAQNALDIATHLTASAGRDAPDYASAVDPERLHELLNSGLDDFRAFAQHVEGYLTRGGT